MKQFLKKSLALFCIFNLFCIALFSKGAKETTNKSPKNETLQKSQQEEITEERATKEKPPLQQEHIDKNLLQNLSTPKHTVLLQGQNLPSRFQNSFISNQILQSKEELEFFFSKTNHNTSTQIPSVNFENSVAVFAHAGSFSTGGFSISFKGIEKSASSMSFVFSVSSPPPDAVVTMAFTSPYILICAELNEEEMQFVKNNLATIKIIGARGKSFSREHLTK
ncbi:MAG: protease complex subunit PrcB family protein [Treponema sp.]|nr:protease complex subunit PrcB family protein [Treponema sp.]